MPSAPSIPPPPVGSVIDNGALELVDVLGYGGYGIVFRAVDTATRREQYAVKCLTHAQAARQRNLHMREIHLHRLASAHTGVVSLSRVVEDATFTYIVLDYYPDGDLFTQILHKRTYLGYEALIKKVFIQLLDAVEHCHDLGIYHRDLKPENVLCKDSGTHVAITDFGLATTDKLSTEFRTGSIYHMSPECHGPDKQHPAFGIASKGGYSPAANDVWSLGIMLLNLATGRNPWKSATSSDPTFWAYLHDRANFLPTVLPISRELNALLVRVLDPIWTTRITLRELRYEVRKLRTIYAEDVVFDSAMARCPWEVAMDPESPEESMAEAVTPPVPAVAEVPAKPALKVEVDHTVSVWSEDTPLDVDAQMAFASPSEVDAHSFLDLNDHIVVRTPVEPSPVVAAASTWSAHSSAPGAWRHRSANPSPVSATMPTWLHATSEDSGSDASSDSAPSLPPTPKVPETRFSRVDHVSLLAIDTDITHNEAGPDSALYSGSSFMRTAVESADDEQSIAPVSAPWTHHFHSEPVKPLSPILQSADSVMDDVLEPEVELDDDQPISPIAFRYMPRADSFTSLGHDADIEDSMISYVPPPAVPKSAPANISTFQPFGAGRSFFAPRTSGASSSSGESISGCTGTIPRTPAGGKTRPVRGRRSTGRFNPLKLALRSLSPRRPRPATASSSTSSRSPPVSQKASVELDLCVRPPGQRPRPVPPRKSTGKLSWLGGRLFGAAPCS